MFGKLKRKFLKWSKTNYPCVVKYAYSNHKDAGICDILLIIADNTWNDPIENIKIRSTINMALRELASSLGIYETLHIEFESESNLREHYENNTYYRMRRI